MAAAMPSLGQTSAPPQQRQLTVVPDVSAQPAPQQQPSAPGGLSVVSDRPQIPRGYALVVGISQYKSLPAKNQLRFADRDANDIYSTLISSSGGQFPAEGVHKLINGQATLANLKQELETWLPGVTGPDDRVFIYFAGHGFLMNGKAYLAPYDVDPKNATASAFPLDELRQLVDSEIKGKWKVMLTDACHSGSITSESDNAQLNSSLLSLHDSLFSFTASRSDEVSQEDTSWGGGHGVFTYYVIQGLNGQADTSGDGVVTAYELANYVLANVPLDTNLAQHPTFNAGKYDPGMLLAYNPGSTLLRYGTFVIDTNMDDVEVWLDGKSLGIFKKGVAQHFPGIKPGPHTVQAAHQGYAPVVLEKQINPGGETPVTILVLSPIHHSHAAQEIFDRGLQHYTKGFEDNYKIAASDFEQALATDSDYSEAALYLGRTYHALYEEDKAKAALEKATQLDPAYREAILSYAAVLLDTGDLDQAVVKLDGVVKLDPGNGMAWYLLSQAYLRKGSYGQAVDAGEQAVKLTPANAEAHLWLAEALRRNSQCDPATTEYESYLSLSNFNSGNWNYYVVGSILGIGIRKQASQQDIWRALRAQAYIGICDCEWMGKRYDQAASRCQKALTLVPHEMFAEYRMGTIFMFHYNAIGGVALLREARGHFESVIASNPDVDEGQRSKKYVQQIDSVLAQTKQ